MKIVLVFNKQSEWILEPLKKGIQLALVTLMPCFIWKDFMGYHVKESQAYYICADVWVILIYIWLNSALVSKLSSGIVECSKNVPGINKTWGEHASESIDSHHLLSWEAWSHCHYKEFNHELSIWWDFSEKGLPSCIVHRNSFTNAWWDYFLTTVERDVVHFFSIN